VERKKSIIKKCSVIFLLLALLGSSIYAWIYGNVTPQVEGEFKIGDMSGLNFLLDTGSAELIDLNAAFGIKTESLNLNEVSSYNGKDFFARDTEFLYMESGSPEAAKEVITFRGAQKNEVRQGTIDDVVVKSVTGDYLDVSFHMILDYKDTDNAEYYIYLLNGTLDNTPYSSGFKKDKSTKTTDDGMKALRVCFRVSGATGYGAAMTEDTDNHDEHWIIFGNKAELGTENDPYNTVAVVSTESVLLKQTSTATAVAEDIAGEYYIDYLHDVDTGAYQYGRLKRNTNVYSFTDYSLDPFSIDNTLYGAEIPSENYLFTMDSENKSVDVTLRVWLEGGSEYCINGQVVPDDMINLNMYFVAFKKELPEE